MSNIVVVVGNPKPRSRTRESAELVVQELMGRAPDEVIELSDLGPSLLSWGAPEIAVAKDSVQRASLVVFASPTFKAAYTGLLKLFLDQFEGGTGLQGVVALPLMLGGSPRHALAPELTLKPVLAELGATTALPGMYLIDSTFREDGEIKSYSQRWRPTVQRLLLP